jgi:hypothetical protein
VPLQKVAHQSADFESMSLQCEMSGVQRVDFRIRQVAPVGLGAGRQEVRIVPAPGCQERRSVRMEIGLEVRVARHVAAIVEDEVELDLVGAGSRQLGEARIGETVRVGELCEQNA